MSWVLPGMSHRHRSAAPLTRRECPSRRVHRRRARARQKVTVRQGPEDVRAAGHQQRLMRHVLHLTEQRHLHRSDEVILPFADFMQADAPAGEFRISAEVHHSPPAENVQKLARFFALDDADLDGGLEGHAAFNDFVCECSLVHRRGVTALPEVDDVTLLVTASGGTSNARGTPLY